MSFPPDELRRLGKMARFDAGEFRLPPHGIERYEHHGCRCDVCVAAHVRVEQRVVELEEAVRVDRREAEVAAAEVAADVERDLRSEFGRRGFR